MVLRAGTRNRLGQLGETLAAEFLVEKGWKILERNLTMKLGEIDILAMDGEVVVVVEVKTQTSAEYLNPVYKITPAKQRKLHLLALAISIRYPDRNIRIDVLTLHWLTGQEKPQITHLENVLG